MDTVIEKVRKNARSELWISLREYKQQEYIDIREHFLSDDDQQWHPTKKGIMVLHDLLQQLIDGIEALNGVQDIGTVATILKSEHQEIQIGHRQFGLNKYGEARTWYWTENDAERKPTQKGITFKIDSVSSLVEALFNVQEYIKGTNN